MARGLSEAVKTQFASGSFVMAHLVKLELDTIYYYTDFSSDIIVNKIPISNYLHTYLKKIKKDIIQLYGPTLLVSGDNLRKIFNFNKYTYNERVSNSKKFCKFAKFVTNQKINLIFAAVGMMDSMRKWYRNNIDNYIEIYIKADLKKIIRLKMIN